MEYRGDYGYDGRRGVKGTGPYGIGGRRYYGRRRDYESGDYNWRDYGRDEELNLTKADIEDWKHNLENADGTMGPHFTATQIMQAAQAVGARMSGYTEEDLYRVETRPVLLPCLRNKFLPAHQSAPA